MNIPGLDLCPTGEDDSEIGAELFSFKGSFQIPKSQMNGVCRSVTEFNRIALLKATNDWVMREFFDPRREEAVCLLRYKDSSESSESLEKELASLMSEIEILNDLKHDNIVHFFEPAVGEKLTDIYLVFDFSRYFLSDLISKKVTGLYQKPMIKNIIHQLLQAVHYLHRNQVMHRDIKPLNILFNKHGCLKLANFRHAKKVHAENLQIDVICKNYQAPEIILGAKHHGLAVDIWSIGCIFAELFLKKILFVGETKEKIYQSMINILGAPNNQIWKDCESLPCHDLFRVQSSHSYNILKKLLKKSNLSTDGSIKMLKEMLIYDPNARLVANECLNQPYFSELPLAYSEEKVGELLKLADILRIEDQTHLQK